MINALRILVAIATCFAAVQADAAMTKPPQARQAPPVAKETGYLIIRNGSDFATLQVTVYRLEGKGRLPVRSDTIGPLTTHMATLVVGDYLATYEVASGTASITENRFTVTAGTDLTINFQTKDKP